MTAPQAAEISERNERPTTKRKVGGSTEAGTAPKDDGAKAGRTKQRGKTKRATKKPRPPSNAERLNDLFKGLGRARGATEVLETSPDKKAKSNSWTKKSGPATVELWERHLAGEQPGLGVHPLRDDATCGWAAIDIDVYDNFDPAALEAKRAELDLPLVVCRSKSGGAHVFIFLKEPVPAERLRILLRGWCAALGYDPDAVEIFPKQDKLETTDDFGNWLNMPYFGGDLTTRYALGPDGGALTVDQFLALADERAVTIKDAEAVTLPAPSNKSETKTKKKKTKTKTKATAAAEGAIPEGDRNTRLTSFGGFLRNKGLPRDAIEAALTAVNAEACDPPLSARDVARIAKSVARYEPGQDPPELEELNLKHAVVIDMGKARVMNRESDPEFDGRVTHTRSSFADFRNRYMTRSVAVGDKVKMLGHWWLKNPGRRQFDGVVFAPGLETPDHYNLWQGFAVEPVEGDWSKLRDHFLKIWCRGNKDHFKYLMDWFARGVQRPHMQGQVAVVLIGGQGTGKGTGAFEYGRLFGAHFLHLSRSKHLVGNFNRHLEDASVVFADEAVFAGDRSTVGALKTLITEELIAIEPKGVDVRMARNRTRIIMAANSLHAVHVDPDDRRHFVLDVSEERMRDHAYFKKIRDQMDDGGREAFLYELQNRDILKFNVWQVPKTKALLEQKRLSMDPVPEWWFGKLLDGRLLPDDISWTCEVAGKDLYKDYVEQLNLAGKHKSMQTQLGIWLKKFMPKGNWPRRFQRNRQWHFGFPPLEECQKAFERAMQTELFWGEDEAAAEEPDDPPPPEELPGLFRDEDFPEYHDWGKYKGLGFEGTTDAHFRKLG